MSNWVWSVTQTNWPTVKSKKVWAVTSASKGSMIKDGDMFIFYVKGKSWFQGIYQVVGDWHAPTVEWPDKSRGAPVSEINLKEIQLGFASFRKLRQSLAFIESKKNTGIYLRGSTSGPANFAKPVLDDDLNLILEELKRVQNIPLAAEAADDIDIEEFQPIQDWDFVNDRIHDLQSPNLRTVSDIITDVKKGKFAIPIFQREYTWKKRQVEELWESIFQGFFIGSILTWNSSESFEVIPVKGAPPLDNPTDIILDGQQRITSMYYAVAAPDEALTDVKAIRFFVDLGALLDPNASAMDIVTSFTKDQAERRGYLERQTQFIKKLFPLWELNPRDYVIWLTEFREYLEKNEDYSKEAAKEYSQKILDILDHVWSKFKIPVVQLPRSMSLDSVAEVFEKINSTGTQLGVFDLLNARFTKYKVELRSLWDKARDDFANISLMDKNIGKDAEKFILQAMCLYKKGYSRRKELLTIDSAYAELGKFQKGQFETDWQRICEYTEKAIAKLRSQRETGFGAVKFNIIPYTVTIPVLAALLYKIRDRTDKPTCMSKIEMWYWATVFSDNYSGSTDTKIEKDFREIQQWFDDDSAIPEIITYQRGRLSEMTFHSVKSNDSVFKAIMCLVSKKGALDFYNSEPPEFNMIDNHHIFPKSRKDEYNTSISINSILNRTLIAAATNRQFIQNQNPSEYIHKIIQTQAIDEDTLRARMKTHLISPEAFECLLQDDFNGFVDARKMAVNDEYRKLISPIQNHEYDIDQLLHGKESQTLEYKSSLRWDVKNNQVNRELEEVIAKEICAFMNAEGGDILIGVDDEGNPLGLERDHSTFNDAGADRFEQHLTNLVTKYLGRIANIHLKTRFHKIGGKEICRCKVKKASGPVYLEKNGNKKFYVRLNNTAQPLNVEQTHNYITEHWT